MKEQRTFIAFELPENIVACLERLQQALKQHELNIRWVKPQNIHLTLKFLGAIPVGNYPEIESAIKLTTQAFEPPALCVTGMGVFPTIKNARVLWTGLGGETETLVKLHQNLETQLAFLGIQKENRPFKAHLTLGRIKKRVVAAQLLKAIKACCEFKPLDFSAKHVVLYQSDLKPNGAVYTPLFKASL
jgi:2'-5' RNA ligase